ncbi:MAG: AAA family ATPase [Gammaproteobacteria bacterium]|nr:AAA family ATPase [Gammaproteobacteria bacterium]
MTQKLSADALYRHCDTKTFDFKTTAELKELDGFLGQERAIEAVQFGIGIRREGYNLYALGPAGIGKHSIIRAFLEKKAAGESRPSDICYVHNFEHSQRPIALILPSGMAKRLHDEMKLLVEELLTTLPAAFESDDYRNRAQSLEESFNQKQNQALDALQAEAESHNIKLFRTPGGFAFAPLRDDEVISPTEFDKLPEDEQERIKKLVDELQDKLSDIFRQVPQWRKELIEQLKTLERETALSVVGQLIERIKQGFPEQQEIQDYLDAVQQDILENAEDFLGQADQRQAAASLLGLQQSKQRSMHRYQVNVLTDYAEDGGAPVVYEDHPTYDNLMGRIEYISQLGTLVTDFTLIKPGALHRANGGYLILDANKLLNQPYSWDGLKRALRARQINTESLYQALGLTSTQGLEPEAVPLDVKIVLVGDRMLYYLLSEYDPDFPELFKVSADFETRIPRDEGNTRLFAQLIATLLQKEEMLPMQREAVARVIEHSSRLLEDSHKLSTHMGKLADLLREADYWARDQKADIIERQHVQMAINAQIRRVDRVRDTSHEVIQRGIVMIDTEGREKAQINGLTVMQLGNFHFGQPSRITASCRLGDGHVVNIEREVELSGPIHSKGVLVLTGYLSGHYAPDVPLSLSATLVFEQSYGEIDGDSASAAELICLLSALSELPIRQSLAITGSINQHGRIQAIGGVNAKVEGFFDICRERGLTGEQGVIIPASNVADLMLREDVVEAVASGQFHLYSIERVEEAIELLMETPAGERDDKGEFPKDSVNARVEAKLSELAHIRQTFGEKEHEDEDKADETKAVKLDEKGEPDR